MAASNTLSCKLRIERVLYPQKGFNPGDFAILACSIVNVYEGEPYNFNRITIKGRVFTADIDVTYQFKGTLIDDPKYGYGYKIDFFQQDFDMDVFDQLDYLKTLMTDSQFQVISRLSDPYGAIERGDINALCCAKGIGKKSAQLIIKRFQNRKQFAKVYSHLYPYGLSVDSITTLISKYNDADQLIDRIENDPYLLIKEVKGIGWAKADAIAAKVGIVGADPRRVKGYILHFMENRADDGHTWCTAQELWDSLSYDLEIDDMSVLRDALNSLHDDGTMYWPEDRSRIALTKYYELERNIARELYRIAGGELVDCANPEKSISKIEEDQGWQFTEEQIDAVHMLADNNVAIVTGYGGCVDGNTEFFTGYGWKKISQYQKGDKVLQYNPDGTTSLVEPEAYVKRKCDLMYHIYNLSHSVNQVVSEEHNVVYLTSKGNIAKIPASVLYDRHNATKVGFNGKFITTYRYSGYGLNLSDAEIRIMCAVICDGHFPDSSKNAYCRINLKKERKKQRLRYLLDNAGVSYTENQWNPSDPAYISFCFCAPIETKTFTEEWYQCTQHQLQIIADEILRWDGCLRKCGKRSFCTTISENADFVQFVFSACGYRASIGQRDNRVYKDGKREYNVYISQRKNGNVSLVNKNAKKLIDIVPSSDGYKYCFTVPSHMFVMRYNKTICITGNTGKSTTVSAILKLLGDAPFAQCALSGRAAARLTEVTGAPGQTIHRLLGYQNGYFIFNKQNQLTDKVIILDEISMVGAQLFYDLIQAIPTGSKLIMLGDDGQLESIGLCNIFKDMLDSGVIPVARLTKIHRQAAKSAIITESIKVRNGKQLCDSGWIGEETRGELQDLTLEVYSDAILTFDNIQEHYRKLLDKGISKHQIQIVLPMKNRGEACTLKVNKAIQDIVNSKNAYSEVKLNIDKGYGLRLDDRVICNQNMYKAMHPPEGDEEEGENCPVYNGDRGVITEIDNRHMIVDFDLWGPIYINRAEFSNIELGYALSCHKLQGSEAEYVIIGFDMASRILLTKEWLYTAITRAKKKCILTCQSSALQYCVSNSNIPYKRTFLRELLVSAWSSELDD